MDTSAPGSHLLLPRNRTARRWLIAVSLLVHVGAIGAYVVMGLWRVEKLQPERRPIEVAVGRMFDPGGGGEPKPGRKPPPVKPPQVKRVAVKVPVQPTDQSHVAKDATPDTGDSDTHGDDDTPGTGGGGDPKLPPGGGCAEPPCQDKQPTPKVDPPKKTVTFVPPSAVEQYRTRGLTQIHPSEVTKTQILREGKSLVVGRIKYCIDDRGGVNSVSLIQPTGYAEFDQRLLDGVRAWGFRPYQVGGQPIPVCTAVTFRYMMK